jgi:flagellar biosynthesis protein FlhG
MHKNSQAASIQRFQERTPTKVIAVSSGKGGVGKTNVATNIAVALAGNDRNVMLLDADLSLANVDVLLGLQPRFNLSHVVSGDTDLESTIIGGPRGVRIVPASSGNFAMTDLPAASQAAIIQAFGDLAVQPEILVVDTASGISANVARFVQAAQEAVIVVCNEPSSITDAYALIKVFSRNYGVSHFQIVTNQTCDANEGRELFSKLSRVTDLYLDVVLRQLGNVPHDGYLRKAVQEQRAVVDAYPKSAAGQAFSHIASKLLMLPNTGKATGSIQFFFERLLGVDQLPARRLA